MKPDLIQWLCCPDCTSDLTAEASRMENECIAEGFLTCSQCTTRFPVVRGIPRFVKSDEYVKSFSYEWNKWSTVQLDSVRGFRESEETFIEKTGFLPHQLENKLVLDAGCGAGRFIDVTSRWGARVVGVDFSFAVEAAQRNLASRANVDIVQADIFRLPFKKGTFDIIFSIGVLHHTRDTQKAFMALPPLLKEDGEVAVWLYYYPDRLYCKASDFWRAFFRHLPSRILYMWCWLLVVLLSNLYRKPFMSRLPWGHLRRVLPVNSHPDFRWRVLDTFDWYSPRYQDKDNTAPRVVRWFREAGLRDIEILAFPTSIRGRRTDNSSIPVVRQPLMDIYGRRIVLFGAGSGGDLAFVELAKSKLENRVVAVCDNDPAKKGTVFHGHIVTSFDALPRSAYDIVIIASLPGFKSISEQLEQAGLVAKQDFASMDYISQNMLSFAEA